MFVASNQTVNSYFRYTFFKFWMEMDFKFMLNAIAAHAINSYTVNENTI